MAHSSETPVETFEREILDEENPSPMERINCEQVTLIWLDPHLGQPAPFSDDFQLTEQTLRQLNDYVLLFSNPADCLTHVESIVHETVLLIVAGSCASPDLLASLHKLAQIDSIFIFCRHKSAYQHLLSMKEYHKLVDVIDGQKTLEYSITRTMEQINEQTEIFALYNREKQKSTRDLNRDSGSFLFLQLVKNVIRKMLPNQDAINRSKAEMLHKCRLYYRGNSKEMNNIDQFEREYTRDHAIRWYTRNSFIYKLINKALRTEDVDALYTYRFYINDLYACLEENCQLLREYTSAIAVYRGMRMSGAEIQRVQSNIGHLIAMNGFWSTTRKMGVAEMFAGIRGPASSTPRVPIIFEIAVNLDEHSSINLADIRHLSAHKDEEEVLFDLGTAFKIISIEYIDQLGYWKCLMSASDEGNAVVQEYFDFKQKELEDIDDVEIVFGTLLGEMGEWKKSQNYFEYLLKRRPDDPQVYFGIGNTYHTFSNFDRALFYFERAHHYTRQRGHEAGAFAANICCSILKVYHATGDFKQALAFGEEALEIYQRLEDPTNNPGVARVLIYMGLVHFHHGHDMTSLDYLERALTLLKETYPFEHPEVSGCLLHLSFAYYHQGKYGKARDCLQQSSQIEQRLRPLDHPNIACFENNIGKQYYKQGKYPEALNQFQRASAISIRTRIDRSRGHIVELNNLGKVSYRLNLFDEAITYYDRALQLIEHIYSLSPDHIYLAYTWKNQGEVLFTLGEHLDALKLFEQAHDMYVRIFAQDRNHRDIAKCKHLMGLIRLALGDLAEAEALLNKALCMWIEVLPRHHPDLAYARRSISEFYAYKNAEGGNGITPLQVALGIYEKRPPFQTRTARNCGYCWLLILWSFRTNILDSLSMAMSKSLMLVDLGRCHGGNCF